MDPSPKRRKVSHNGDATQPRLVTASPFVLQTDELLKEVKVNYKSTFAEADELLKKLRNVIDGIPAHEPSLMGDVTRKFQKKHQIQIPFPDPKPPIDAPYKLAYEKPSAYNVVGSYVSRTMVKSQDAKAIDMIVQMPPTLFQEKDFQSMRYFYRRAYYIANIAAGIQTNLGVDVELEFENFNENPLLPVLVIHPASPGEYDEDLSSGDDEATSPVGYAIRIIPCAPEKLFPKGKLLPSANCNKAGDLDAPTPFYNSTVKAEETFVIYLRLLARARTQCSAFADACILGRVWLQQRGFGGSLSQGGYGHFEWALTMALLLQTGGRNGQPLLSSSLSSTELFKATIQFLGSNDFIGKPFVFGTCSRGNDTIRESGPVIFDVERELNFLYKMTPWSARLLQHYTTTTIEILNASPSDDFEATFIARADVPLQMFDTIVKIEDVDLQKYSSGADRRGALSEFCSKTFSILQNALKDRTTLIHIQSPGGGSWSINEIQDTGSSTVLIGLLFDPASMAKSMEYGPSAELKKEAAKFRQFWGERAELRRFKDGSILECVPWSQQSTAGICEEIVSYVLKLHLGIDADDLCFHGQELPSGIEFTAVDKDAFDAAKRAFQTMEHEIRSLEGMPLSVKRLAPVCPELRYCSILPPSVGFHNGSVPPMNVALSFEASSRWPENLVAIQETKIDFLLDIDRRLKEVNDKITTSLGRDNATQETENLAYLDVIYDNGAAFRLRIQSDLEETLLDRQSKNKTLDPHVRTAAEETLFGLHWQHGHLPLHTQSVASFCTRLLPLSAAIRMTKQWFNTHKLAGQISEELIELLVIRTFLQPQPWKTPSSAHTGFLRTLFFLSRWDWRSEPLIVDFSDELSPEDHSAIRQRLETWRTRDPNMNHAVLFAATTHETSGLAYTRRSPSKLAATRMTRLAKSACSLIHDQGASLDIDDLFSPSLGDYDVLIHLSQSRSKRALHDATVETGGRLSAFKNLDARTGKVALPLARPPWDVLLGELQAAYDDSLIFFHGGQDDTVVGAIWQPRLRRQGFRVGLPYNIRSVEGDDADAVEINKDAVLLEIARVGGDLIKKIEVIG